MVCLGYTLPIFATKCKRIFCQVKILYISQLLIYVLSNDFAWQVRCIKQNISKCYFYTIMLLLYYPALSQYHHQKYTIMLSYIPKCHITILLLIFLPLNISVSFQLLHNSGSSPSIPIHATI